MRRDEVLPTGVLAPYRRRRDAVPLENVCDGLMRQVVTEVGQCACNPIVAPTGVLAGHVDDEILDDRINAWAAPMLTMFGTVELVGDQTTVPGQNGLWLVTQATSARYFRPRRLAMKANVERSGSESRSCP